MASVEREPIMTWYCGLGPVMGVIKLLVIKLLIQLLV